MEHEYCLDPVELKAGDIVIGLNDARLEGKEFIVAENNNGDKEYPLRVVYLGDTGINLTITLFGWLYWDKEPNLGATRFVLKRPVLLKTNLDDFFNVV